MNILARNMKKALIEKGLTQADICREFGLSSTRVYNYFDGRREPDVRLLFNILQFMGVTFEDMMKEVDDEKSR